jgi:ankyrin repeat protein
MAIAAECGNAALVELLAVHGASFSLATIDGLVVVVFFIFLCNFPPLFRVDFVSLRPIHLASYNGHIDVIEVLMAFGDDIEATSFDGLTPVMHAHERNTVRCLLKFGATVSAHMMNSSNDGDIHDMVVEQANRSVVCQQKTDLFYFSLLLNSLQVDERRLIRNQSLWKVRQRIDPDLLVSQ